MKSEHVEQIKKPGIHFQKMSGHSEYVIIIIHRFSIIIFKI